MPDCWNSTGSLLAVALTGIHAELAAAVEVAQGSRDADAQAGVRDAAKPKSPVPVWREGLAWSALSADHQRILKAAADRARLGQGPVTCQEMAAAFGMDVAPAANLALFEYIDGFRDSRRIQERLGRLGPIEFEEKYYADQAAAGRANLKPRHPLLTSRSATLAQRRNLVTKLGARGRT
ncbi:hypothetical protein PV682_12705 [Streptomyces niveiscabiei]|uniref:hypothetical protein n=1 Tax=Streptomyces niveiscabiei TaxID=164115 RepID=UPI0029A9275E|nr:hypothetical protein [Streptomyces niveiscabiei]